MNGTTGSRWRDVIRTSRGTGLPFIKSAILIIIRGGGEVLLFVLPPLLANADILAPGFALLALHVTRSHGEATLKQSVFWQLFCS